MYVCGVVMYSVLVILGVIVGAILQWVVQLGFFLQKLLTKAFIHQIRSGSKEEKKQTKNLTNLINNNIIMSTIQDKHRINSTQLNQSVN